MRIGYKAEQATHLDQEAFFLGFNNPEYQGLLTGLGHFYVHQQVLEIILVILGVEIVFNIFRGFGQVQ